MDTDKLHSFAQLTNQKNVATHLFCSSKLATFFVRLWLSSVQAFTLKKESHLVMMWFSIMFNIALNTLWYITTLQVRTKETKI